MFLHFLLMTVCSMKSRYSLIHFPYVAVAPLNWSRESNSNIAKWIKSIMSDLTIDMSRLVLEAEV